MGSNDKKSKGLLSRSFSKMTYFKDKTLLVTGGTGSFGSTVVKKFIKTDIGKIIIFSRDEKKQEDMRIKFSSKKLEFQLGDIRDPQSVSNICKNVDFIFHAAALKQVPSCEFFPMEAVKTNIIGAENLLNSAISNKVKKVILLSTDKAVYPINAMGFSKALMEKLAISKTRNLNDETKIMCTRYGNVMATRGSVIPLFIEQIINNNPITITDKEMTRFLITLDESVKLVMHAFQNGKKGEIFVKKSPSSTIYDLANALIKIFNSSSKINYLGIRHGEKKYETLVSKEEKMRSIESKDYFCIKPDNRDLNYQNFFSKGNSKIKDFDEYNSNNTNLLNENELITKLKKLDFINKYL